MSVPTGTRWVWTADEENHPNGLGKGTAYQLGNVPMDLRFIPAPETAVVTPGDRLIAWNSYMRYAYDHTDNTWKLSDTAEPASVPEDFYDTSFMPRYDIDPNDPLRNSWVLKPDAGPPYQG